MTQHTLELFQIGKSIGLETYSKWQKSTKHTFERQEAIAILAALAIKRPLLVRGEPGCGKTQLARAAAQVLGMPMATLVVNERTETEDLFWKYDALRRLSDANSCKIDDLAERKYLRPGPLWWALDNGSAKGLDTDKLTRLDMAEESANPRNFDNGVLLLIDEIDKADRSVPNSLLESLDDYSFPVPYTGKTVTCENVDKRPLVIITTNDEQQLPPAFVRRCLVLDIVLPEDKEGFIDKLASRGKALFDEGSFESDSIYKDVAELLWEKRKDVKSSGEPYLPGQAEYLDHLATIKAMKGFSSEIAEADAIKELSNLAYGKNKS